MTDLLIRDIDVVDGTGAPRYRADVLVDNGRITEISSPRTVSGADKTIDPGLGYVLTPGFIDMHAHSDLRLLTDPGLRVSQRNTPNTKSAIPITMRTQGAHGGALFSPPSKLDTSTKIAVNAANPTTQPTRNARPVGFGRGVCSTNTAGMIESGERATTSARGMSSVSSEAQPAVTRET